MELSILIAKIIAVLYITSGFALLIGTLDFDRIVEELLASRALVYIAGSVAIMIGVVLVGQHNTWVSDWTIMITLICWSLLIGGIVIIIFPDVFRLIKKLPPVFGNRFLIAAFMMCIGAVFAYFGFIL